VILLVHHSGKDQSRGMRGWSGLHAAMDFVVECQREGEEGSREAAFRLAKVKDGTTGTTHRFRMDLVPLGADEDGDPITSLTVRQAEPGERPEHPFKVEKASIREIDAETSAADDTFIFQWVAKEITAGNYPSKNSLKSQLPDMKASGYVITQDRVLAAVARLLAEDRLSDADKAPHGNKYIRPFGPPPVWNGSPLSGGSPA